MTNPLLVRGDARRLPLADEAVDLIVTSPPYFGLRSYTDAGRHYTRQIGSEATPAEFLDALVACTREMVRVLKPTGSIWINLGDKYAQRDGQGPMGHVGGSIAASGSGYHRSGVTTGGRMWDNGGISAKSLMLLPHRYAIRCADELGLIVRQDQVWAKPNGLPESVTDRTRRSHEYLFHLVKQPRYYSAVDEIREPHAEPNGRPGYGRERPSAPGGSRGRNVGRASHADHRDMGQNTLGKLPGSVWTVPTQPLNVPEHVSHTRCCGGHKQDGCKAGIDHYAAFPMALVRPIILGWSPRQVCTACGEGHRPLSDVIRTIDGQPVDLGRWKRGGVQVETSGIGNWRFGTQRTVTGYACGCPDTTAPTAPGVVLDPFGGTATAPLVAAMVGRLGISVDASWDYCDVLARWRVNDPKERARAAGEPPEVVARITPPNPDQLDLFA